MNKQLSSITGITLILLGLVTLMCTLASPFVNFDLALSSLWRLWPLTIVSFGVLLVLPPLLLRRQPTLGLFFILGTPVLTTGGILLFTSVLNWWDAWVWLWPLELLGLALGFVLAALYAQQSWLAAPAIVIGLNGLVFQFCALTGWWASWAVLWTIEPLSLGLALLVIGSQTRWVGLLLLGLVVCGLAGASVIGMTVILSGWWLVGLLGPICLICVGALLLFWGLLGQRPALKPTLE